jgi:hypothetical protein
MSFISIVEFCLLFFIFSFHDVDGSLTWIRRYWGYGVGEFGGTFAILWWSIIGGISVSW